MSISTSSLWVLAKWVSTTIDDVHFVKAQNIGFRVRFRFFQIHVPYDLSAQKLFDYISGANEDGKKVPMTCPVRSYITAGDGPFCATKFTVSFFVPFDYSACHSCDWIDVTDMFTQEKTPKPSTENVFIEETPEMTVYVASFGGYMNERDVIRRAATLVETLKNKGISIVTEHYYASGYDSPFRLWGRHNEIWIMAKESVT